MKETIDLLGKIITNILTALYEPFGFSLLLSFLAMFFYLYAYESMGAGKGWKNAIMTWYQKFKESVFFRKLFFLAFVTSLILFRTLLNRQLWMNPLSDVMGGWGIWETVNGEQKLTTECIENVIMMVPFSAVVMWTFEEKIGNGWKKILWQSGKIAFIFSISIEMLQLLLRLGTFQLSHREADAVRARKPAADRPLPVQLDHAHALAARGEDRGEAHQHARLPDAAFLVACHDDRHPGLLPGPSPQGRRFLAPDYTTNLRTACA